MLRFLITTLFIFTLTSAGRASEMMSCDNTDVQMVQAKLEAANDPALKDRKEKAATELELAKTSMKSNELEDCSMHLANAMNLLMRKS